MGLPTDAIDQNGRIPPPTDLNPIIQVVKRWLANQESQKWLMIVDNYDDLDTVHITDFLPHSSSGCVIVTSRAQAARRLGSHFELDVIELEDGIEILRKSAGTNITQFAKGV